MDDESADYKRLDYEKTIEYIKFFTDIRFKLLAFVPLVSGLSLTVLNGSEKNLPDPITIAAIGILGLMAVCGIAIYDMRNTQLYHAAMTRARGIEESLDLKRFTENNLNRTTEKGLFICKNTKGGLISERAEIYRVGHDLGLSIVYGASISGWIFIILYSYKLLLLESTKTVMVLEPKILALIFIFIIIAYNCIYRHITRNRNLKGYSSRDSRGSKDGDLL